jgi:hypothetical protein
MVCFENKELPFNNKTPGAKRNIFHHASGSAHKYIKELTVAVPGL